MEALAPLFSFLGTAGTAASGISSIVGLGKELFSGGGSKTADAPATVAKPTPTTPGVSPTDYTNQQEAYYKQMLAGLGMGSEGGQLPQGIQDAISKQASLL